MDLCSLLDRYVPHPQPTLVYHDPFSLLCAVMLSAHCTDKCVNTVTPMLYSRAPTVADMAAMPLIDIETIIRPCGLMRRKAYSLKYAAKEIVERFHGIVPSTLIELESLPGVGRKTALVVLSLGFDIPTFPVDTHIFRLAKRWHLSQGTTVRAVENDLCALFPMSEWKKRHLQIIAYARQYCPARYHHLDTCPICQECGAMD